MVQLLPLLEAVRDHPLPSTHASRRKRFTTRNFRNHGRAMLSRTPEFRTTSISSSASPRCIEGRPPASVIVLSQLEIVALAVHPYRYSSDACPRIQPCAKCPQGAVVGGHRAPGEANSRAPELAAWVEHGLLDDLVRSPQHDGGIVRPSALAVLRLMTSSNLVGCSMGKISGFGALQNLVDHDGSARPQIHCVRPITHRPPARAARLGSCKNDRSM
jgi:hypothetical protein